MKIRMHHLLATIILTLGFAGHGHAIDSSADGQNVRSKDSVFEGKNSSGGRWAYEFIFHSSEPTLNLATDSAGVIVFADSEHVVRAMRLDGSWDSGLSTVKTELSFYSTKTCRLVGIVSVPNHVFAVGRIGTGGNGRFYIGTITPAKYMYDDCPLAITLVDLPTRSIERIPLVAEDYWFALGHEVEFDSTSHSDSIILRVDHGSSSQYLTKQPQREAFKGTRISYSERQRNSKKRERPSADEVHRSLVAREESGLAYLGAKPPRSDGQTGSDEFALGQPDGAGKGIILAKASGTGKLTRFDLGTLRRRVELFSAGGVSNPIALRDGSLACIADGALTLIDGQGRKVFNFPGGEKPLLVLSSGNRGARSIVGADFLDYSPGTFRFAKGDRFWRLDLPGTGKFEPVAAGGNVLKTLGPDDHIVDWDAATSTFVISRSDPDRPRFQRLRESTGEPVGIGWDGGGKQVYDGVIYSPPSSGWRALSFVDDATTGGMSSCVMLEKSADGSGNIEIATGLPTNADPLGLVAAGENVRVVFGSGDKVEFVEVSPSTGAVKPIRVWTYASRFGKSLLDPTSGIILIPGASGFEAWSLPGEGVPQKEFDLILADDDSFAILLPNGLYAGSPGCEKLLRFGSIEGTSVSPWRNRPAEVLRALGGNSSQIDILERVTERWLSKLGNPDRKPEPPEADFPILRLEGDVPLWAESGEVTLRFNVQPGASPIRQLVVRVNGVDPKKGANEIAAQGPITRNVRLAEGQNWIEAVAIDTNGLSSNQVRFRTILRRADQPAKRFVIAMGVSEYRNQAFNLQLAEKDATDFSEAAVKSFTGSSELLLLRDGEVTRDSPDKIRQFLASATENDEVIAFGAGHGVLDENLDYYFCSHEFDLENPATTSIRFDDLVDALSSSKALKRLLLLDTCHSGKVGEKDELLLAAMNSQLSDGVRMIRTSFPETPHANGLEAGEQQRFIEDMFLLPGLHRGLTIIGAAAGAQFALESPQWNNGVFTASILEALIEKKADSDGDGRIGVSELRDYSGTRVAELTHGAQNPSVVSFEQDQDFDLIKSTGHSSPEAIVRDFFHAIESRDESGVAKQLAETVDYYTSGTISKKAVMADIKADWKRYDKANYKISSFAKIAPTSFRFILDYDLLQGDRPFVGKLQIEMGLSGSESLEISKLKSKVISAW